VYDFCLWTGIKGIHYYHERGLLNCTYCWSKPFPV
jgi:hypothetical protein